MWPQGASCALLIFNISPVYGRHKSGWCLDLHLPDIAALSWRPHQAGGANSGGSGEKVAAELGQVGEALLENALWQQIK